MNTSGKLSIEHPSQDVIQMDLDFFPNPWTPQQWSEINPETSKLFTFRLDGDLLGWALFGTAPYDDAAHLYKILIHPSHLGDGTAQSFWSEILVELRKLDLLSVYLEVESTNHRAIRFYSKCGFSQLRRNKGYYSNGDDALIMSLTL